MAVKRICLWHATFQNRKFFVQCIVFWLVSFQSDDEQCSADVLWSLTACVSEVWWIIKPLTLCTLCNLFSGALGITKSLTTLLPTTHLETLFRHAHQEWLRAGAPPLMVLKKEVAAQAGPGPGIFNILVAKTLHNNHAMFMKGNVEFDWIWLDMNAGRCDYDWKQHETSMKTT